MPPSRSDGRPRRRRGVLRHYDRPFFRDRLFWLVGIPSAIVTALIVGVLLVVWGVPDGMWAWVRLVLIGVIVLNVAFRLLGAGVTSTRHFQRGLGEGSRQREGDLEAKGRAAGAVVGKALRTARATRGSAASRTPASSTPPAPTTTASSPSIPAPPAPASTPAPAAPSPNPEPGQDIAGERGALAGGHAGPAAGNDDAAKGTGASTDDDAVPGAEIGSDEPATGDEGAPGAPAGETEGPAPHGDDESPPAATDDEEAGATDDEEAGATGDEAEPTPAPRPARPPVTADKAARVAGAMVGRRLAERRRRQQ